MTTRYEQLLAEAAKSRAARDELAPMFDDPEETVRQRAFNHDADAYLAVQEALAEQQRIANLIALGVANWAVPSEVREKALRLALEGLGL